MSVSENLRSVILEKRILPGSGQEIEGSGVLMKIIKKEGKKYVRFDPMDENDREMLKMERKLIEKAIGKKKKAGF